MRSTKQVKYANVHAQTLVLIGFMGCGKSTVGRLLAQVLGVRFVDLDKEIEVTAGRSVPEIFRREGEERFRKRESKILQAVLRKAKGSGGVLALGGGTVLRAENRELLQRSGFPIVWLNPAWNTLWVRLSRLEARKRPLLWDADRQRPKSQAQIKKLWQARRDAYRAVASATVRVSTNEASWRTVKNVRIKIDAMRSK